jgi:hypothetical protein
MTISETSFTPAAMKRLRFLIRLALALASSSWLMTLLSVLDMIAGK